MAVSNEGSKAFAALGEMEEIAGVFDHGKYVLDDSPAKIIEGDFEGAFRIRFAAFFGRASN